VRWCSLKLRKTPDKPVAAHDKFSQCRCLSFHDLRSATNARAGWAIGVLSGAHDLSTLGAEAHTHLLPSVTGLPALFGLHD